MKIILGVLVAAAMLAGCGDKKDAGHYSATGMFNSGTPACGGGDVCNGGR